MSKNHIMPKTFRDYCKIERKYFRRFAKKFSSFWENWISYTIDSEEKAYEVLHTKYCKSCVNLPSILKSYLQDKDKYLFWPDLGEHGYLRGIKITNNDYYYIVETDDGTKISISCVASYKIP